MITESQVFSFLNAILDIPVFATSLVSLDLSFNKIHDIRNLEKLTNLTQLYLLCNKIKLIEGLETLVHDLLLSRSNSKILNLQQIGFPKSKI
jgi:protein phosphatase 1 regulatory subunit 7